MVLSTLKTVGHPDSCQVSSHVCDTLSSRYPKDQNLPDTWHALILAQPESFGSHDNQGRS